MRPVLPLVHGEVPQVHLQVRIRHDRHAGWLLLDVDETGGFVALPQHLPNPVANSIVIFLLLLSEISIALLCAAAMYFIVDSNEDYAEGGAKELSTPMVPVMLVAVIAWFIADKFMGLFGNVVDSTLLMFCVDKEKNSGTIEGVFMSDELARLLGEKKVKPADVGKENKVDQAKPMGQQRQMRRKKQQYQLNAGIQGSSWMKLTCVIDLMYLSGQA